MDAVILAVSPEGVDLIIKRKQTMMPRKTKPKLETPFKVYIYQTKKLRFNRTYSYKTWTRCGRVIGEFICDYITDLNEGPAEWEELCEKSGMPLSELYDYFKKEERGYGWNISKFIKYHRPLKLWELSKLGFKKCGYSDFVCGNTLCDYWKDSTDYNEPPLCTLYCSEGVGNCKCYAPPQDWYYVKDRKNEI